MKLTVKDIKRINGEWVKGTKLLVAYSESKLYSLLSRTDFIEEIEDFFEGEKLEDNRIKYKGVWFNYYGDPVSSN